MQILVIDYISPEGHKNFDYVHVNALSELGYGLHLVGRRNQFASIANVGDFQVSSFPEWTFKTLPLKQLSVRVMEMVRLKWVFSHVDVNEYDAIIMLSYDVLSLFPFRFKKKVLLINHNNVSQLADNKIKLYLTRRLRNSFIHIALNVLMEKKLGELLHGKKVVYVPHGLVLNGSTIKRPSFLGDSDKFVFCPVNRNHDAVLLQRLLDSKGVTDYLECQGITFYVKKTVDYTTESHSIRRIMSFLSTEEYYYMIEKSVAVILPYGQTFKYRCSGIFFECIARDANIIATKIPDLEIYKEHARVQYFGDENSFIQCLKIIDKPNKAIDKGYFNPKKYWLEAFRQVKIL